MNDNLDRFDNDQKNNQGNGLNNRRGNQQGGQNPKKQNLLVFLMASLISLVVMSYFMKSMDTTTSREIPYNEFVTMLEAGEVESVYISSDRIIIYPVKKEAEEVQPQNLTMLLMQSQQTYYTGRAESNDTLTQRLLEAGVEIEPEIPESSNLFLDMLLSYILPLVLVMAVFGVISKRMGGGGGPMGVGKSNAKVYVQKETGVTFKDVAGEDEAKESLQEVVDFLHNPGRYAKIGAKLPKGALLVGPPGTGKTLLAKAVAGEAHVPFFSLTGSDFIELYVGVGASRVRDLFKEATKNAPCIIFIDEIDAIGRSRDSRYGGGGNEEREQTLNQLLSEMDGFDSSKGILILGATNRPEILDKALLRPGRFDRRIIVDKPDLKGRVEILKVHAKDVKMDETVDFDAIALATSGAVGSDLANMINEAAINAVKEGREFVSQKDLFDAVEQVLVGKEKKDRIMSKEERKIVSYHEVGHALISALQKNSEPVQKITIVPRTMGALGYVMHVPEEEKYLNTEAELRDRLVSILGGRAAEEIVFDTVTTGAANDIEKATDMAKAMVTQYGMSKRFGLMGLATVQNKYLDGSATLNCSDVTAAAVDEEVKDMLKESYDQALHLLRENREVMDKLAEFLIEKETITGKEFMKIFRKVKGIPEPEEETQDDGEKTKAASEQDGNLKTDENLVELPSESFQELFSIAKEAGEDMESSKPNIAKEGSSESAEETARKSEISRSAEEAAKRSEISGSTEETAKRSEISGSAEEAVAKSEISESTEEAARKSEISGSSEVESAEGSEDPLSFKKQETYEEAGKSQPESAKSTEEASQVRGNYSKVSADKLWKDLK